MKVHNHLTRGKPLDPLPIMVPYVISHLVIFPRIDVQPIGIPQTEFPPKNRNAGCIKVERSVDYGD